MNMVPIQRPTILANFFNTLCLLVVAALLIVSFWGRNNQIFFILEVTGFSLTTFLLLLHRRTLPLPIYPSIFIIFSILSLSLYLLPIPVSIWLKLPGHSLYQEAMVVLDMAGQSITYHSLSVDAYTTAHTLLALLPPLAVFIGTAKLPQQQLGWLAGIVLSIATMQGLWGIIQYAHTGMAQGSFFNRDHFAGLMELTLPIAISLLVQQFSAQSFLNRTSWQRISLYTIASSSILLAGLFSLSRAGAAGLGISLLLSLVVFGKQLKLLGVMVGIGLFLVLAVLLSGDAGFIPLINRFLVADPLEDVRWTIYEQAMQGVNLFFPLGTGPGTFQDAFTPFQTLQPDTGGVFDHAHNDYLELIFETGIIGAAIIVGFSATFLHGLTQLWHYRQHELFYLKAGAAIGIVTALFHAFFDFNLHTPAYPVFLAYLNGLFFRTLSKSDQYHRS